MTYKVNAITLHTVDYKDSDKIITFFTLEKGKISAAARGVRKANAKLKGITEPFCFAELVLAERFGRNTVTEADVYDSFYPIRTDIVKYYVGMTALEFSYVFMQEELEAPSYYAMLLEFLQKLAYSAINPVNLLVKFMSDALGDVGYGLNLSQCGRCGEEIVGRVFLSANEGVSVCEHCKAAGDKEYSFKTWEYLKGIYEGDLESGDNETRSNALKFFQYYLSVSAGVSLKCLATLSSMI